MSHRKIDIIFFDAGRTLLYPRPEVAEVYAAAGRKRGIHAPLPVVFEAFRAAYEEKSRIAIAQDREWWRDAVRRTFARLGSVPDPDDLFDELYDHFARPGAWRLYPTAGATLSALRERGYRTGLISNWDDRLPALLEGLGIAGRLDPVVVSYRVGVEKPHPRIFATALEEAEVPPERALMVGDDREADVVGARAAGLTALHLDRSGEAGDLASLAGLLKLLPSRRGAS